MMCESGWTGDRCQAPLHHEGPHTNDSTDEIVSWLEGQEGSTAHLMSANKGAPVADVLNTYYREGPRKEHWALGEPIDLDGVPYGFPHDLDCPGCVDTPFTASPRSETYWSS